MRPHRPRALLSSRMSPILFAVLIAVLIFSLPVLPGMLTAARAAQLAPQEQVETANYIAEIRAGPADVTDTFEEMTDTWETYYTGISSMYLKSGRLHVSTDDIDELVWSESQYTVSDFYLEVDAQFVAGTDNNQFGVIFRYIDDENFYYYGITSDGYFVVDMLLENEWINLVEWQESNLIEAGAAANNTLGVLAEGDAITLLVNDYILAEVEDDSLAEGRLALGAAGHEVIGIDVAFDNMHLWSLGAPLPTPISEAIRVPERPGETVTLTPSPSFTPSSTQTPSPTRTPSPTGTSGPTLTPSPTRTPTAAPTSEPDATAQGMTEEDPAEPPAPGEVRAQPATYEEDFSAEPRGWIPPEDEDMDYRVEDGALYFSVTAPNRLGWSILPQNAADFYLEFDARFTTDVSEAESGVLFRILDTSNYYFFAVNNQGNFSVWLRTDEGWTVLYDWETSEALNTGVDLNRIGLMAYGDIFRLYANDQLLAEVEDSSLSADASALAVGSFEEVDVTLEIDNLRFWSLDDAAAGPDSTATQTPVSLPTADSEPTEVPAPTMAPTEEAPAEPAASATPEPGEEPEDDAGGQGAGERIEEITSDPPDMRDEFRRATSNWETPEVDTAVFFYEQSALHVQVLEPDWFTWAEYLGGEITAPNLGDFYAEVGVTIVSPQEGSAAGYILRKQGSDSYYYLAISADGFYTVYKRVEGEWTEMAGWTSSAAIETGAGQLNQIGVLAEGSRFTLLINGTVVSEFEDDSLGPGSLALMAVSPPESDAEIAFDNFALWVLD